IPKVTTCQGISTHKQVQKYRDFPCEKVKYGISNIVTQVFSGDSWSGTGDPRNPMFCTPYLVSNSPRIAGFHYPNSLTILLPPG
ncbi:hypothetical protein CEXT_44341, partial [Caerostris extrusa]